MSFLVDPVRYRDRVLCLQRAAERVGRMTLLVPCPPPDLALPASEALRIVPLCAEPGRRQRVQLELLRWWRRAPPPADLLHDTQGFMLPLFAALGPAGPPRLTSNFASTWDWFAHLRGRWPVEWRVRERRYWAQLAGEWALARVADAFTVFAPGHRALFAETYQVPMVRVFALPNCLDPQGFSPVGPFTPTAGPTLLFVGSVFRYKGVHELLEAVARLSSRHPRLRLDLVGAAPDRAGAAVQETIRRFGLRGRVRLLGAVPRDDLPAMMRGAAAVVLPSYTEGSPRVLIEAMACGRPVVGTDIAGVAALDPERRCTLQVPRCTVSPLAEALHRVLADPVAAAAMGARARARFLAHHTPAAAGDALATIYQRLRR